VRAAGVPRALSWTGHRRAARGLGPSWLALLEAGAPLLRWSSKRRDTMRASGVDLALGPSFRPCWRPPGPRSLPSTTARLLDTATASRPVSSRSRSSGSGSRRIDRHELRGDRCRDQRPPRPSPPLHRTHPPRPRALVVVARVIRSDIRRELIGPGQPGRTVRRPRGHPGANPAQFRRKAATFSGLTRGLSGKDMSAVSGKRMTFFSCSTCVTHSARIPVPNE
jgi:hypothetical protein